MTTDEAFEFLLKVSFGCVEFIYAPRDEDGLHGSGRVTGLSKRGFSITTSDGRGLVFALDADGLRFEDKPPMFLQKEARELLSKTALLADGMLMIWPEGSSLFVVEAK